ncbi:gliding motility-associated C-terminal domain-containing protein [Sphingobacterium sp. SGG-5]|uniref:choice-of-anchor Q domain-containing protein n=1 Tax=Sphingobacterium sp. SGG-5 TaxID=2710881 RepID=UPI0013EA13AD|nr:choice-of-anchor Q domain-containing protein [Sphingobacterium sp. SGG-5]NGM63090.1 gliding motility-associated C-terminal domain-containing protein [Sphingobacterium sp. SGG-5]
MLYVYSIQNRLIHRWLITTARRSIQGKSLKLLIVFLLMSLFGASDLFGQYIPTANVLYVDANVTGGNSSGDSWTNASTDLAGVLQWAKDNWDAGTNGSLQIWVAMGMYNPTTVPTDYANLSEENRLVYREATFQLVNDVEIYGGFSGTGAETTLAQRNWRKNPTILSGDIDKNDMESIISNPLTQIQGFNSYTVVTAWNAVEPYLNNTAKLDGFIVTGGQSDHSQNQPLSNRRSGGGMYIRNGSPVLTNLVIQGNVATNHGGGVWIHTSTPTFTNVTICANSAGGGGAVYNRTDSDPVLDNVLISGNQSSNGAGGFHVAGAATGTLRNVTITGNRRTTIDGQGNPNPGAGIFIENGEISLYNSIVWSNGPGDDVNDVNRIASNSSHNLINGGRSEVNIAGDFSGLTASILFESPKNSSETPTGAGDYRLRENSPAINAGNNAFVEKSTDIDDKLRIIDDNVDLGAYEVQHAPVIDDVLFVRGNVSGGNESGDSWNNAIPELSTALQWAKDNWNVAANGSLQIWVAEGIYKPTSDPSDRDATFQLANGVEIYGGFTGTETTLTQRNWQTNATILSGDIDNNDTGVDGVITNRDQIEGENSYTIVNGSGVNATAVLDGFILTGGLSNGSGQPRLPSRSGGGIYNDAGNATFSNLLVSGHATANWAGGVLNFNGSSPTYTNVIIQGCNGLVGGGMLNHTDSHPILTNVLIRGNRSNAAGGMANIASSPILVNVTITGNERVNGAGSGLENRDAESLPTLYNSIIWGNGSGADVNDIATINANSSHNLIKGADAGVNIPGDFSSLTAEDLFVSPLTPGDAPNGDGDYRLRAGSPAINAGSNAIVNLPNDILSNARIRDGIVDLGVYEVQEGNTVPIIVPNNNTVYVKQSSTGTGMGNSWDNAVPELRDALSWTKDNWDVAANGSLQIWVAEGIYKPTSDPSDRDATFQLANGVEIYGGFAGTETTLTQRDWQTNATILSGDIDNNDTGVDGVITNRDQIEGENSYTIVNGSGVDATAVLDGFILTGGLSNGSGQPRLPSRSGGGIYNDAGNATFSNLIVSGHATANWAGGVLNYNGSSPTYTNVIIQGSNGPVGGGMLNHTDSHPTLTNVLIRGNQSNNAAGGMANIKSSPILVNVTITGNKRITNAGSGLENRDAESLPTLYNSIIWGNGSGADVNDIATINANSSHNLIKGADAGVNIPGDFSSLTAEDLFVSPLTPGDAPNGGGDYRLRAGSPAINAGSNVSNTVAMDLDDNNRMQGGIIDIGAFETSFQDVESIEQLTKVVPVGTDLADIPHVAPAFVAKAMTRDNTIMNVPLDPNTDNWIQLSGGTYDSSILGNEYVFRVPVLVPDPAGQLWFTNTDPDNAAVDVHVRIGKTLVDMHASWNGAAIDLNTGLNLTYGDIGNLQITHNNTDTESVITASFTAGDEVLDVADLSAVTTRMAGVGYVTFTMAETENFESTTVVFEVSVAKKDVVVVVNPGQSKTYGSEDPELTFAVVDGLVNNDGVEAFSGALERTAGEEIGIYPIGQGTLSSANYEIISFTGANFEIGKGLQVINFTVSERLPLNAISLPISATSDSGLPVTLTVEDTQLGEIREDGNLYLYRLGTMTITASQEGNNNYEAAETVVRTIRIFNDAKLQVAVHPALSPNGDGINDFLHIENIADYPDNKVTIFDRQGHVVTEIQGYDNGQHVFTGQKVQDDTYFYIIEANIRNRTERVKGYFVVKRN